MDIIDVQKALIKHGFNPGEEDGVWGRRTISAVKIFQKARGLVVDGVIGPITAQALLGITSVSTNGQVGTIEVPLVWYQEAVDLIGTKEILGRSSNDKIIKWSTDLNIDYKSDDIPWCGLFISHCIAATLPEEILPKRPLLARSWQNFGEKCTPQKGSILVFWRGSRSGNFGHVGLYKSEDSEAYHVLGGNQNNSVNITRIGKNRLLSARWPRTASHVAGRIVEAEARGALSNSNLES